MPQAFRPLCVRVADDGVPMKLCRYLKVRLPFSPFLPFPAIVLFGSAKVFSKTSHYCQIHRWRYWRSFSGSSFRILKMGLRGAVKFSLGVSLAILMGCGVSDAQLVGCDAVQCPTDQMRHNRCQIGEVLANEIGITNVRTTFEPQPLTWTVSVSSRELQQIPPSSSSPEISG